MKSLPEYETVSIPNRPVALPDKKCTKMVLVLDLDETLVHCSVESIQNADLTFPVYHGGSEYKIHARKRPHMDAFLKAVSSKFEVVIFTASQKAYAEKLLDLLDPNAELVK